MKMPGDMRQQAGTTEKVDKNSVGRILSDYLDKVFGEISLLAYERKGCGKIQLIRVAGI